MERKGKEKKTKEKRETSWERARQGRHRCGRAADSRPEMPEIPLSCRTYVTYIDTLKPKHSHKYEEGFKFDEESSLHIQSVALDQQPLRLC